MLFTLLLAGFEFIIIAVGFTFGYFLLVFSSKEMGWKRIMGYIFAWLIITNAVVVALMSHYQWIEYLNGNSRVTKTGMACPIGEVLKTGKNTMCNPNESKSLKPGLSR